MDATLCILAGGEGQRMGRPKAELLVRGVPILEYLLERLGWSGPTMLVTSPARRSPRGVERFDREAVDPADGLGPLRGLLTSMENLATSLAIVTTVDMPAIGPAQLEYLVNQIATDPGLLGAMYYRIDHVEPFPSVYRANALDVVREQFAAGERSVGALSRLPNFRAVHAPRDWPAEVWTNLNTPDDLARFIGSE